MIKFSTLWKFAAVVALSAICAFLYLKFLRPADLVKPSPGRKAEVGATAATTATAAATAPDPAFAKLSALIDAQMNSVLSPLEEGAPSLPQGELLSLRQSFAASARTAPQRTYQTAVQLCDTVLLAIQEHERSLASLADTRAKPHAAATSANQKKEQADKQRFFEEGIKRRWAENSKTYRSQIAGLRTRLEQGERQIAEPAPAASAATVQTGDTIVLPRATPVRLKYGSATLPAGLSLRVLGRTANSLTVDYSGEQVVVPWP